MAAHAQAAHNGQYYTHSAGNESQQVYFHPHQPPQHQQHLQQQQGHAPQSHFQSHSTSQPQPQPDGADAPNRHPSFIGLPPISRASTFSSLLRPFQVEGSAGDNNSTYSDAADTTLRNSVQYQQGQHQQSEQTVGTIPQTVSENVPMATNQTAGGVPPHGQFTTQTPPPGQFIQNMYRPTQGPAQGQMQSQGQPTLPNDFSSPPANGSVPGQSPVQTPPGQHGPPGNAQGQPGSAPAEAPGAPLPATNGGAPPIAPQFTPANGRPPVMMPPPHLAGRFPQGNWNLQESHLSEPLQPTNRHRHSSSNTSQQPFYGFDKETGVPASPRSQRAPDTQEQQPADQNGQRPQPNGQENPGNLTEQRSRGKSLSQTNVDVDDLPAPGPIPAADGNSARRNSGLFSSLRNRVGAGTPVTSDAVSDASVMTDETGGQQQQQQRRAQMFSALGAGGVTEAPQSKESIIAHGSTTPVNGGIQLPPPQHHQQHQVKKSIMGLKAMFSRSSQQQDASRPTGNAQSPRPTTQGQAQNQHHQIQQPAAMSGANPMSPLRPKTSGQVLPQQHQSLASIAESEKARKPSSGIFGMFKNKDAKQVPGSGPNQGQPLMDPRQTLQGMGRGQMPNPPPGQGQFPQQQQQYRQQFPVGPDGKLVIFPGQLPPQHQQFMQQGHPSMHQLPQMKMQGQTPGQQRPQVNMQQSQPSVQGQNGGPQNQPQQQQQQQQQQQLDTRQGLSNGQNNVPTGPISPPAASPAPLNAQSTVGQSPSQQNTPPTANGQAPSAATIGGHARTFSQGSNLPNMYTFGMNGNQPNQLPARKPVGSRVVSAQIPPSLAPQQQQRQRGASVSSTQLPQTQSPPSTQPPSSLGSQRPSDSQHTLTSQGGKSLPDVPTSTQRADQESSGSQDQHNQGPGRQQQPQPQPMPTGPQNMGQDTPNQNVPPPNQPLPRAMTMGPGFPAQLQQQQQSQRPPQPSPGFPPPNVMTAAPPPKEKEQSTISKLFRGTKQQTSPTTPQEKGKSSFMTALKRGGNTKQGEAQPKSPAQSPQANQGQFQPNQQPQRQPSLQPPQTQFPGQPQQQQQQQQESRPGLGERRPSPHLQYQNERQDLSKAPSPPVQADLTMRPPGQPSSQQQPTRPPVTSAPGAAAPNQPRPTSQMIQQAQPALPQGQPGPVAPGLVQGQRPAVPGQPLHPHQMAGQAHAQAFAAQQQFFQAQAQAHAQAQMFQRFQQQQQAQLAAAQGQAPRPGQPPTTQGQGQGQNPATTSAPPGQEPRYAQVPIPAGYFPVHQGMAAQTPSPMGMPMPYFINVPGQPPQGYFMLPPGQMLPPGMPGMSQMLPPGFVPGQPPFMYAPHPGAPMPPPGGAPPGTMPPMAAGTPGSVVTMATPASAGTPTPFFTPPTSLGGPQQQQVFHVPIQHPSSPPPSSEHSVQHPPSISPTPPPFIGTARQPEASNISPPQPQMQQQFQQPPPQPSPSPPNYPLPNMPFSPVNPDAANVPNPPLPVSEPQQQPNPGLIPRRQVSQVSAMSLQPSNGSPSMNVISPISNESGVTQIPDGGQGQQQLSRSGSAAVSSPDSRTVSPEPPVNVAQRLFSLRIDEDGVDDDKDSKKGENDDDHHNHHNHHWNNEISTTDGGTDSRAVSPEPLLLMDEHGPTTPPPTTISFIRAQAQEVHVHRSPDRHVGDNNIYDATPRQSIKSPVLLQRRDSLGEQQNEEDFMAQRTTEDQDFSVRKIDGLADIREESPENGNSHFIVAPPVDDVVDVQKFAQPAATRQVTVENGETHHGDGAGSKKDEREEPSVQNQVEHVAQQQQQPHIANVMIVSVDEITQPSEQQKNTDRADQQQPPQPQLQPSPSQQEPAAPVPPAQQPHQKPITISLEPSPATSPEPSKSQPQATAENDNSVITTASGFIISYAPNQSSSPPTDPSNPKGILKPLTDRSIFEEAKRKQLLREQEEKIPVFADDDDVNGGLTGGGHNDGKKKKEDEDAVPMMSATSYPGQEWNPYDWGMGMGMGAGPGDWED